MPTPPELFPDIEPERLEQIKNVSDVVSLPTKTPTNADAQTVAAVAQMIIVDGVSSRVADGKLYVNTMPLSELRFLGSATLSDDPKDPYDLQEFLHELVIHGATAALIKNVIDNEPDRAMMLTALHAVVPSDIHNTYFIFDRPQQPASSGVASHLEFELGGANPTAHRAAGIRWPIPGVHQNPNKVDFCLIELEPASTTKLQARALPLGTDVPRQHQPRKLYSIGHPLGIPSKRSDAAVLNENLLPTPRVYCDFASGGSGTPMIHEVGNDPVVVGVLTGNARFTSNERRRRRGKWVVHPRQKTPDANAVQPLVSASQIRNLANRQP